MKLRGVAWGVGMGIAIVTSAGAEPFTGALNAPSSIFSKVGAGKRYTIEVGFEYLHPSFDDFPNIVVENPSTSSNSATVTSPVVNDYPDVFAQTVKFQMLLSEQRRTTLSLKTFLPLNSLAQIDTGFIYVPEYALYRTDSQRPRVVVNAGMDLADNVRAGIGFDIGFSVNTTVTAFFQNGSGKYSDQRVAAKVKPSLLPQASLSVGSYDFIVRSENKGSLHLDAAAGARVFSGGAGYDFAYQAESAAFFDPWSFEFHGRTELSGALALDYGVAYQLWSRYQPHALVIPNDIQNNCNGNGGCSTAFSRTLTPDFVARNLWIPQFGVEWRLGDVRLEGGYRFKDSIFAGLPQSGNTNYLDPPRHDFWFGATFPINGGWELSADLQVSQLVSQTVVKSNSTDIGGPSYVAAGRIYGGGARLVVPF